MIRQSALVLGVNGQDGSYLAERLLARGYAVTGVGRQAMSRHVRISDAYTYVSQDLTDSSGLDRLIERVRPDIAFHVAAVHGAAGSNFEAVWRDMVAVNVNALQVLLEHARVRQPALRIIYAGTCKIFPAPWTGILDEKTPHRGTCLYSIGKIASRELIEHYRLNHRIAASNLILFNHESPRRGPDFFVPTIARALASALRDPRSQTRIRTLDFRLDWGAADEFMEIAADIGEQAPDRDFVLASGRTWHAREAVVRMFESRGLDYRQHLLETEPDCNPGPQFQASIDRLERVLGRRPLKTIFDLVEAIVALHPADAAEPGVAPLPPGHIGKSE